jgi:subfamily B ATP-binding cassette protein MsbA
MKTYFRLLSFAKPLEKFAIPYIIATIIYIFFNTLNLALLTPLMDTIFSNSDKIATAPVSEKPSIFDITSFFGYYVNIYITNYGAWKTLQFVCAIIVISVFLANVFRYLSQRIMENLRAHTLLNLRKTVFGNVMNLHLGYFNNERKGDIISKITSDVQVVQYSVTSTLQVVFKEPVQLIFYLFVLFLISAKLTLVSLLIVPVAGLIIGRLVKKLKQQATESQQSFGLMISYLDEALAGIKIIKAFNVTDRIKGKFNQENKKYTELVKAMARRQQLASPVSEFLSVCMVAGILLYGGYLILNNSSELKPSEFIAYIAIFSQIMRPAKALTDAFSNIHAGIAAGERVLELIDTKPAIVDRHDAKVITGFINDIEFKDVTFGYQDKTILNNVSLTIPKGKTIALVANQP